MNIVIPMAGLGSRFEKAGYTLPKPLIDVLGKPMIRRVVDNIGVPGNYYFIAQRTCPLYDTIIQIPYPSEIIKIDGLTEGAACTVLKARSRIDSNEELLMANSDQMVLDVNFVQAGIDYFRKRDLDGGIWCFLCKHPKWSYARIDDQCLVTEVAEKNPISDLATVGTYYFKKGSDFVRSAEQMIQKNIRVNNEFYTCPVYNELIGCGGKVGVYMVNEMVGLGTPEDLESYIESCR